jgi:uncharacterized protein
MMITKRWRTSERKFEVLEEKDVPVPMGDGTRLDANVFRPAAGGRFPAILGLHCYDKRFQTAPIMPTGMNPHNAPFEAGDPNFYVRRGYAQVVVNVRGTGASYGTYSNYGRREVQDTGEIIRWLAGQPWCDGNVGMFGVSYYAVSQQQVAALNPPDLKCIFAPFGYNDFYRDKYYHGGILSHAFMRNWSAHIDRCRAESWSGERLGESGYREAIARALEDQEIGSIPYLVDALRHPEKAANPLIVDILTNPFDGSYYHERNPRYENDIRIPSYLGACWGNFGLHLPGAFRSWERIRSAPKRMTIGPPVYLDRPLYQYHYESLRWFDHWLKGMETGIMEGPPIRLFIMGTDEWKSADEWPLPETMWTPFYLHEKGLLSEHEFFPGEGADAFEDSPAIRGSLKFFSPPLVENTEVVGPISLNLYASTTADEVLWFVSLWDQAPDGAERLLTRGWLRGSQRAVDPDHSLPWKPFHSHTQRKALTPGEVYEFNVEIVPTGNLFRAGHRICLKISCVDDEPPRHMLDLVAKGHLWRQAPSTVTVYHDASHPSHLLLPITRGNVIGTYMSGGHPTLG